MVLADYQQDYPVAHSLGVSSIVAALPLIVLFVLLGIVRMRAWLASVIGLVVAIMVAVVVYSMPIGDALNSGLLGAAFGFFPIMWIVINAIWVYNLTVETGHFDVLRRSFASISDDQRIQAIIIAFCFGALMEALAGFGTPVAISSVMLIALGFRPLKAATVALVANTAPVAFGALAVPITTLATVRGCRSTTWARWSDGRRRCCRSSSRSRWLHRRRPARVRQVWPAALLCGVVFGVFQYLASNYWSIPLADIIASLASALAVLAFTRVWHPKERLHRGRRTTDGSRRDAAAIAAPDVAAPGATADGRRGPRPAGRDRAGLRAVPDHRRSSSSSPPASRPSPARHRPSRARTAPDSSRSRISSTGRACTSQRDGDPVATTFKLNYLSAAGTLLLISGMLTMIVLQVGPGRALRTYARSLNQLKMPSSR